MEEGKTDIWLFVVVLALAAFGVLEQVRLASFVPGVRGFVPLLSGIIGGVAAAFAVRHVSFNSKAPMLKWTAYVLSLLLPMALIVFGRRYRGGLYLPGRINPSEIVKLVFVVFAACQLSQHETGGPLFTRFRVSFGRLVVFACLMLVTFAFVVGTGDFGLLAQLAITAAAMIGVTSWFWGVVAWGGVAMAIAVVALHPVGHLAVRISVWKDPFSEVTGAGWQTLQGIAALVTGGMTGRGFGLGDVQNVPIVASDFVYAAVAEDMGFLGCFFILAAWTFVFTRGIRVAVRHAGEGAFVEALLAAGIVSSLAVQTVLNVAGVLNVLPMTGITLPLISLGGSSQATILVMCGILIGLSGKKILHHKQI